MASPTRTGEQARSVITYYPSGPVGRVLWSMLFLAITALCLAGAGTFLRSQHVVCERASGTCSIGATWGPLRGTQDVPIAQITGTRLVTTHDQHRSYYSVVLVTRGGDVALSRQESTNGSQRAQARAQVDHFLATPGESSLDVAYDPTNPFGLLLLAFSCVWLIVTWSVAQVARIEVDWPTRTLWVVTVRWPLRPKRVAFELDAVRDAVVMESSGRKGGRVYAVGLVLDGQDRPVGLNTGYSSGRARKDQAVTEIQAMLASRDAAGS